MYKIANESFSNKAEVVISAREILGICIKNMQRGVVTVMKNSDDEAFFLELLQAHPKYKIKKGCGIDHLKVCWFLHHIITQDTARS